MPDVGPDTLGGGTVGEPPAFSTIDFGPAVPENLGASPPDLPPFAPGLANLVTPGDNDPIYDGWGCQTYIKRHSGLGDSPRAVGPDDPRAGMSQWRYCCPWSEKIITWVARARGGKPKMPSSDTGDPNDYIKTEEILAEVPSVGPDGTPCWSIAGRYVYGMQVPSLASDPVPTGEHPMTLTPAANATINVSDFFKMLGASTPGRFAGGPINF